MCNNFQLPFMSVGKGLITIFPHSPWQSEKGMEWMRIYPKEWEIDKLLVFIILICDY